MAAPQADWVATDFKDELVRGVGASVTPGVDETPYIQYALDVLTWPREDSEGLPEREPSSGDEANPMYRLMPNATPGLFQPPPVHLPPGYGMQAENHVQNTLSPEEELAARRRQRRANSEAVYPSSIPEPVQRPNSSGTIRLPYTPPNEYREPSWGEMVDRLETPPQLVPGLMPREVSYWEARSDQHDDPEKASWYPPLTFRPWMIGTPSLLLLATVCTLMVAALMFCAIYSNRQNGLGLVAYSGTLYDGYYFVFRILPQLLAAVILLYAQNVITTAFRVLPFSAMASDDLRTRRNVGFLPLYPKSFLWPQLVSTWQIWIPIVVTWILNITVPLQSSLFTVAFINGTWVWSTVQGVAWILVALYLSMLVATGVLISFWHNRRTGLLAKFDMRSIADIIFLVAQSNSLQQYLGTERAARRNEMRHMLYGNIERLGYWFSPQIPENGEWYGIGLPTNQENIDIEKVGSPIYQKDPREHYSTPDGASTRDDGRHRYLPWCIRNSQVILWFVVASVLLIVLFIVSFHPATDVRQGFLPGLSSAPVQGAFSAADFLYSFLPSLLGMALFLMFQSLDLTLRILTPWGELSRKGGSRARTSILVDYATCLPLESTWKAAKNRHWRVAFVSLLSTLFILIPVLAGGMFMALTPPSGIVRMYPNIPVYAILLALLVLFLAGIASFIPNRDQFRLPHAVTCLSEIVSFCYDEELRSDPAFEYPPNHRHLKGQLGAFLDKDEQSRWCFGTGPSRDQRLGVKRYGKYTGDTAKVRVAKEREKAKRHMARKALKEIRGDSRLGVRDPYSISRPVPKGSTLMLGP